MALSVINIGAFTIMIGVTQPVETLTANAFGDGNLRLCGNYLNRGLFVNHVVFFFVTIILLNCKPILLFLDQDPTVVKYTMEFTIYGLPGLYFETIFNVYRRSLNSMRHSASPLIASTLGSIITGFSCIGCRLWAWNRAPETIHSIPRMV